MIQNYINSALRNLLKNKTVSLINIIGLAIGLAAFIMILSFTSHELSFDKFHEKSDRIYRCVFELTSEKGSEACPQMVAACGPSLKEDFPEIDKTVRFREPENRYLGFNNNAFYTKSVLYSDSTLFDVFSFRLLQGNPKTALAAPYSIVLSVKTAEKIFGTGNAVGKMITLDNKDLLTVTGIVEDAPSNSHVQYSAFISFSSLYKDKNMYLDWNGGNAYYTYILVRPGTNIESLAEKFPAFLDRHINYLFKGSSLSMKMFLQPLLRIYLHSNLPGEIGPVGNPNFLILLAFIALLIFVIACINFINLISVRLTTRLREIGVRKILGGTRIRILLQFMTESVIMNLFALLMGFIIAESFMPLINKLLGQNLAVYSPSAFPITLGVTGIIVLTGIIAGCYPALYLTSFGAVESVKNTIPVKSGKVSLRKVTVLLQYTISMTMIICSLFLFKQLHFIRHKDPGFERKDVLVIPIPTQQVSQRHELLKSDFLSIQGIESIALCSDYPGRGLTRNGYFAEGYQEVQMVNVLDGDEDLVSVLGLRITQGRNFSRSYSTDNMGYLINETYAQALKWSDPSGKYIGRNGKHEVIGVFKDFNFASLHENVAPLIISRDFENGINYMLVRAGSGKSQDVIHQLKTHWDKLVPEIPFESFYLEEASRMVYKDEQNLSQLVLLFTILAIFIAFLGLFGLSSFETERQTKNIGIRKVNGARPGEILLMLAKGFIRWVMISFIISCPLAFIIMTRWLRSFAYKTPLSMWIFLFAGVAALLIALVTISWQTLLASRRDPVEALRYE
jgi:putative ABC transport system permease protein